MLRALFTDLPRFYWSFSERAPKMRLLAPVEFDLEGLPEPFAGEVEAHLTAVLAGERKAGELTVDTSLARATVRSRDFVFIAARNDEPLVPPVEDAVTALTSRTKPIPFAGLSDACRRLISGRK